MIAQSVFGFLQLQPCRFFLILILIWSCFSTNMVQAQMSEDPYHRYFGFEVHFGAKTTRIVSDFMSIHNMDVLDEGGTLGLLFGNEVVKTRLQMAGFYYSSSRVRHTVNIVTSGMMINVYPLRFLSNSRQALNPYVSTGLEYNFIKFEGYYATLDKKINYSRSAAPYIGKIASIYGTAGVGIEWRLPRMYDFVHIFAEFRYSWVGNREADELLKNTSVCNVTSMNAGVSFGFLR